MPKEKCPECGLQRVAYYQFCPKCGHKYEKIEVVHRVATYERCCDCIFLKKQTKDDIYGRPFAHWVCTNPEKVFRYSYSNIKQRTGKACRLIRRIDESNHSSR